MADNIDYSHDYDTFVRAVRLSESAKLKGFSQRELRLAVRNEGDVDKAKRLQKRARTNISLLGDFEKITTLSEKNREAVRLIIKQQEFIWFMMDREISGYRRRLIEQMEGEQGNV